MTAAQRLLECIRTSITTKGVAPAFLAMVNAYGGTPLSTKAQLTILRRRGAITWEGDRFDTLKLVADAGTTRRRARRRPTRHEAGERRPPSPRVRALEEPPTPSAPPQFAVKGARGVVTEHAFMEDAMRAMKRPGARELVRLADGKVLQKHAGGVRGERDDVEDSVALGDDLLEDTTELEDA
jgi:hypothetical protein